MCSAHSARSISLYFKLFVLSKNYTSQKMHLYNTLLFLACQTCCDTSSSHMDIYLTRSSFEDYVKNNAYFCASTCSVYNYKYSIIVAIEFSNFQGFWIWLNAIKQCISIVKCYTAIHAIWMGHDVWTYEGSANMYLRCKL